ncbi:hypothetical protein L6164_006110 [Bauhinia variegata]|uniref:Uncharacterized protein n=1 Tax=Bauhinia variegata TaxID=167791 RepID=A0ACB9PTY2_BAUVA|nr:hypothetical protein L6164_006110 [Bauhinia variegata]
MEVDGEEGYRPPPEFEEDGKEPLIDLSLTDSSELWLIQLPSQESIVDIDGQELSLKLHHNGQLASFEGSSGKVYDVVSLSALESDATVFFSSSRESKMDLLTVGKISRQVSIAHYPDPKELEKVNSVSKRQMNQSSSGISMTTSSRYFPMQSSKRHTSAVSTQSSRQKSSLSEVGEPSSTPKRRFASESYLYGDLSNERSTPEPSRSIGRGHSTGNSSMSSEYSRRGKSKKRFKHNE